MFLEHSIFSTTISNEKIDIDAILHALEQVSKEYDYAVLLQPTSPLRTSKHIDEAIMLLNNKNADAIISVSEMNHSPLWANQLADSLSMENFLDEKILNKRSQDLSTFYRLNGAIYICNIKKLLKEKTFFIKKPGAALEGLKINIAFSGNLAIFFLPSLNSPGL